MTTREPNIPTRAQAGERPPTGPALSPEQAAAVRAWVQQAGTERLATIRGDFSEADFLAGAMACLFALGSESQIPPLWFLGGPMVGRSLFTTDGAAPRATPVSECPECGEDVSPRAASFPRCADCAEDDESAGESAR